MALYHLDPRQAGTGAKPDVDVYVSPVDEDDDGNMPEDIEDAHIENARDAMRWIYRQLESEYEWQNADEQVDESIRTNEYEFTEDGERY